MSNSIIELLRISVTNLLNQLKSIILIPIYNYQNFKNQQLLLNGITNSPKLIESPLPINNTSILTENTEFLITSTTNAENNLFVNTLLILFIFIMFSIVLYSILYNTKFEINENLLEIDEIKEIPIPKFPITTSDVQPQQLTFDNISKFSPMKSSSSPRDNLQRTYSNTSSLNSYKSNSTFIESSSSSNKFNFDNSGFSPSERLINFSRSLSYKNNLNSNSNENFKDDDDIVDEEITEKSIDNYSNGGDTKNDFAQDDFINDKFHKESIKLYPPEKYQEY
ncbi:hypothetical protein KGF54_005189 [Candida jiufengensis]|uniref:uncharacterized protein n=1 Tax=Candida jiufengensis TaxID=497108 RepID=UPI00222490B7|nr:uncharacterized protein KGF54_005189 [Candida jiufengensis]KAI5950232.1 hypothetical protein KGF54_005189 [Candida jiufengensis]